MFKRKTKKEKQRGTQKKSLGLLRKKETKTFVQQENARNFFKNLDSQTSPTIFFSFKKTLYFILQGLKVNFLNEKNYILTI